MPLQRRLPKFGFKNINRIEFQVINLDVLQLIADKHAVTEINREFLVAHGYADKNDRIKILARLAVNENTVDQDLDAEYKAPALHKALNVTVHAVSGKARQLIEAAGGKVTLIVVEPKVDLEADEKAAAKKAAKSAKNAAAQAEANQIEAAKAAKKAEAAAAKAEASALVAEPKAEAPVAEAPAAPVAEVVAETPVAPVAETPAEEIKSEPADTPAPADEPEEKAGDN
jgi:ribosomal protein L15